MNDNCNAWSMVERYLKMQSRTQSDLARELGVSSAAVTLAKKGEITWNAAQLSTVVRYLGMSDADETEFYTVLFNRRLIGAGAGNAFRVRRRSKPAPAAAPCCPLEWLEGYEALLEPLGAFLLRSRRVAIGGRQPVRLTRPLPACGLPPGTVLILRTDRHPRPGELILAAPAGGAPLLRRYWPGRERIVLRGGSLFGPGLVYDRPEFCRRVCWMQTVEEIVCNFRQCAAPENGEGETDLPKSYCAG